MNEGAQPHCPSSPEFELRSTLQLLALRLNGEQPAQHSFRIPIRAGRSSSFVRHRDSESASVLGACFETWRQFFELRVFESSKVRVGWEDGWRAGAGAGAGHSCSIDKLSMIDRPRRTMQVTACFETWRQNFESPRVRVELDDGWEDGWRRDGGSGSGVCSVKELSSSIIDRSRRRMQVKAYIPWRRTRAHNP